MEINGKLSVQKWINDSPYTIYSTQNELNQGLTKIGSIGFYNSILWYRKDINNVIALVSTEYLTSVINNLAINNTFVTDITNNVITSILNNTFITNLIDNSTFITNLINSSTFANGVLNIIASKLNVEVRSIKNKKLFFAFDPLNLPTSTPPVTLPPYNGTCTEVQSINIIGNMNPLAGSTHTYNLNIAIDFPIIVAYTVQGGVINTNPNQHTIQVTWNLNYTSLAGIHVGVGCPNNIQGIKYDWNFFILG